MSLTENGNARRGCKCPECRRASADAKALRRAGVVWTFDPDPGASIAARIAEVFADADRARMAELDRLIAEERERKALRASGAGAPGDASGQVRVPMTPDLPRAPESQPAAFHGQGRGTPEPARRPRGVACPKCGSLGTKHKLGCPDSLAARLYAEVA